MHKSINYTSRVFSKLTSSIESFIASKTSAKSTSRMLCASFLEPWLFVRWRISTGVPNVRLSISSLAIPHTFFFLASSAHWDSASLAASMTGTPIRRSSCLQSFYSRNKQRTNDVTTLHMHRSLAQLLDFFLVLRFFRAFQVFFGLLAELLAAVELGARGKAMHLLRFVSFRGACLQIQTRALFHPPST